MSSYFLRDRPYMIQYFNIEGARLLQYFPGYGATCYIISLRKLITLFLIHMLLIWFYLREAKIYFHDNSKFCISFKNNNTLQSKRWLSLTNLKWLCHHSRINQMCTLSWNSKCQTIIDLTKKNMTGIISKYEFSW